MTNKEKWNFYLKDCVAPQSFIDMGLYFMIGTALQRRVWEGSQYDPLFANLYAVLCGPPGVGKSVVLNPCKEILQSPKITKNKGGVNTNELMDNLANLEEGSTGEEKEGYVNLQNLIDENRDKDSFKKKRISLDSLPHAADATTFESLIREQAMATRHVYLKEPDYFAPKRLYIHNSMYVALSEMSTLFDKNKQSLVNYLLAAFESRSFEYTTKHQGEDRITNLCLSFIAGTTPDFMKTATSDSLITEGFSSRTIFIYEGRPRFYRFSPNLFTEEQIQARKELTVYIEKLTKLYGQVTWEPDAYEFCRQYAEEVLPDLHMQATGFLQHYYARKVLNLKKMCMIMHFLNTYENFTITLQEAQDAFNVLTSYEGGMKRLLGYGVKSIVPPDEEKGYPRGVGRSILTFLSKFGDKGVHIKQINIYMKIEKDVSPDRTKEALSYLAQEGRIKISDTNQVTIWHQ